MTNITKLAQSLKRRAASANEFSESLYVKADDVLALVDALEKSEKTSEARREAIDRTHNMFVRERDRANAAEEALEKAQRDNAAQDDHINQQQDRIDTLEKRNAELGGQLSRYSMSPGQADQRACESRAARDALGFGKDADDVAPIDLRERIDGMKARIAELEREQEQLRPVGVMSEKAFHRLENSECRFVALWPRPGIFLPRKRPEDGVIVYARTVSAVGIKVEAE